MVCLALVSPRRRHANYQSPQKSQWRHALSKWQRSKQTHLEFLERHALGKTNALNLTLDELARAARVFCSSR